MWLSPSTLSNESRSAGFPLPTGQTERLAVYLGMVWDHRNEINLEYPCHSPTGQRWFNLWISRR